MMPIKFRCPHCRQLLGIARAKAGLPVDCPTCGRTVRVPHLDGRVEPLPKPGLNLEDSSLVQALDQLALIGSLPPDEKDEKEPEFSEFVPDPIEVPAAPAPIPVVVQAPAAHTVKDAPGIAGKSAEPAEASAFREVSRMATANGEGNIPSLSVLRPRGTMRAGWFAGLAAFAIGLAGFVAGYVVGARSSNRAGSGEGATSQPDKAAGSGTVVAPAAKAAIRGRITYKTDAGDSRPDAGARVLVFPQQRQGEVKLPVAGFRAADSAADFQVALASLRALGGDVAVVKEDGTFEAALPSAGNYQVLVVSHFQSGDADAVLDPAVKRLLETWFQRPEQLVGRLRHHLGQCRYAGDTVQLWDYSFERAT